MAALDNPKHEAFAQAIATGMSQEAAYERAGYKPNRSHASRLVADGNVASRVRELQQASAEEAVVTAADLSAQLESLRIKAVEAGQFGAAVQATMGRAKLHGLIIDKAQVEDVTPVDPAVRQAEIKRLAAKAGLRAVA